MSETNERLDSGIDINGEPIEAALEGAERLLGHGVMYSVGDDWNILVPREWLLERMDILGIPEYIAPKETTPTYAFKRAVKRYKETGRKEFSVTHDGENFHDVTVEIKDGDKPNLHHVYAQVFYPEEEVGEEGGKHVQQHLGYIFFDSSEENLHIRKDDEDLGHLAFIWRHVNSTIEKWSQDMRSLHIGRDIRGMMFYGIRDHTQSVVPLRDAGAVYFFPAGMSGFLDGMTQLYSEIGENYKTGGSTMAIRSFPIMDREQDRQWILEQVETVLSEAIDEALDEAWEALGDGDSAGEIVKVLKEHLGEHSQTATVYNALLETELDLEEMLENQSRNISDEEKEEIIERVMTQTDIGDF